MAVPLRRQASTGARRHRGALLSRRAQAASGDDEPAAKAICSCRLLPPLAEGPETVERRVSLAHPGWQDPGQRARGWSATDGRDQERRQLCLHWLVHEAAPTLLDAAGETESAKRLRELPYELAAENVRRTLEQVRDRACEARTSALARLHAKYPADYASIAAYRTATYAVAAAVAAAYGHAADAAPTSPDAAAVVAAAEDAAAAAVRAATAAAYDAYASRPSWIYDAAYKTGEARLTKIRYELTDRGFELLDQMLPPEPVQPPAVEDAEAVCALP